MMQLLQQYSMVPWEQGTARSPEYGGTTGTGVTFLVSFFLFQAQRRRTFAVFLSFFICLLFFSNFESQFVKRNRKNVFLSMLLYFQCTRHVLAWTELSSAHAPPLTVSKDEIELTKLFYTDFSSNVVTSDYFISDLTKCLFVRFAFSIHCYRLLIKLDPSH